eukprot:snap_masked-scaffold_9-processed-gene-6.39-mRNA-1 protein AED:1.00 eAED:1.00 QI:0/-1/0/0/-1/1/1/0/66
MYRKILIINQSILAFKSLPRRLYVFVVRLLARKCKTGFALYTPGYYSFYKDREEECGSNVEIKERG